MTENIESIVPQISERRKTAEARNAKWRALSPKEQLESLDRRSMRAVKQRARLSALIAASAAPLKEEAPLKVKPAKKAKG